MVPHAALPVPEVRRIMITALFIALVVIALAAGFILNRDDTRLRP